MAIPPVAVVRAAQQVDLKVVRYPGSIELRLVGMGQSPDVRQIKTDNGWLIEVNTLQVYLFFLIVTISFLHQDRL